MQAGIDRSGLPFATRFMDKSGPEERQSGFVGMHEGALMTEEVRDVEGSTQSAQRHAVASGHRQVDVRRVEVPRSWWTSTVDHAAPVMPATSCQVWKARSRAAR